MRMALATRLSELVRACFTGIWIESHEQDEALTEIRQLCRTEDWRLAAWDIDSGLRIVRPEQSVDSAANDPLAAIRALSSFPESTQPTLLVLANFHRFLNSVEIVQALARQFASGKHNKTFVLIL